MTERNPISTPALPGGLPFDASQIQFTPAGAGAVAEQVQTTLRRVVYADQYMVGDGVTNDTAGWLNFKAVCLAAGIPGRLSAKTYLIDAFSFQNNSGLKLYGASNNPNFSQVGGAPQTVLKLRTASASFVTFNGVYDLDIQNIHFDGNQFADSVFSFSGVSAVTDNTFVRCSIDGATPTTGTTISIGGTIEVDYTRFIFCNIGQILGGNGVAKAASLIVNTNTNAFNIYFEHCRFQDAINMFDFGAGSCSFNRCSFFNASTTFFKVRSITQPFAILDPYTEQATGVPFFKQFGTAGVTGGRAITIGMGGNLNSTNDILLNCQQPVRILGLFTGGNIDVSPLAVWGTQYVYAESVGFAPGKGWTGAGYPSRVVSINENDNLVPQVSWIGPGLNVGALQAALTVLGLGVGGQVEIQRTANDTLNGANTFLKIYDPVLGVGLFGQQKLSSPFPFVLTITNPSFSTIFPLALGSKLYPVTDANAVQTASGIYAGTGVPNNANGANGDIYFRSDGGAGTTIYQRRAGSWVATGA